MRCLLVLIVVAVAPVLPAKLPPYIKACKRSDPKLAECTVKRGREAIPTLVNGDPKLGIPRLDPLEIDKIILGDGTQRSGLGLALSCDKCKISGLRGTHLEDGSYIDLNKRHIALKVSLPTLNIKGTYHAQGKVLILPIKGDGDLNVTLGKMKLTYQFDYDLKKGKDNKEYIHLKNPKLDFNAEKFNIQLTNLFNGDKTLGKQMNLFLNENWREVLKEFGPAIGETVSEIVFLIVNSIAQKVPYDDIFPK